MFWVLHLYMAAALAIFRVHAVRHVQITVDDMTLFKYSTSYQSGSRNYPHSHPTSVLCVFMIYFKLAFEY